MLYCRSWPPILVWRIYYGRYYFLRSFACCCHYKTDCGIIDLYLLIFLCEANDFFLIMFGNLRHDFEMFFSTVWYRFESTMVWYNDKINPQECVVVLAKLLLPEVFEKVPLEGLRALIAENFSMTTFVREESIVIPENSTVFLLEGVLRSQQLPEVVVESPAVLLASYRSLGSSSSEMPGTWC